jgi:hypothetical protein
MFFWLMTSGVLRAVSIAGILLMLIGVVQVAVRKKTGLWKDGGANLLAGFIVIGVLIGLVVGVTGDFEIRLIIREGATSSTYLSLWPWVNGLGLVAGFVVMLSGVVQLAVRKKTGLWKDGGANLLAGFIVAGVCIGLATWIELARLSAPPG